MRFLLRLFFVFAGILLLIYGGQRIFLIWGGNQKFKTFAEQKVSELIQAKVRVQNVKVGLLNEIAFTGLRITPEKNFDIQISEVIFQYDFLRLLAQSKIPGAFIFRSPAVTLNQNIFPYGFFSGFQAGKGQAETPPEIKIKNGSIRWVGKNPEQSLQLEAVDGRIRPDPSGTVSLSITADAHGLLEGRVRLEGQVHSAQRTHRINLFMEGGELGKSAVLPLKNIHGTVLWVNDSFSFDQLQGDLLGWNCLLSGSLGPGLQGRRFEVSWRLTGQGESFEGHADYQVGTGEFSGRTELPLIPPVNFTGIAQIEGTILDFPFLKLQDRFVGDSSLDLDTGNFNLRLKYENQIVELQSSVQDDKLNTRLKLDHFKFYGLDLVLLADLHTQLQERPFASKKWSFKTQFESRYVILDFFPLDDLKGNFEVTRFGAQNIDARWGNAFEYEGNLFFDEAIPSWGGTLAVNGFDLGTVKNFANRPLPKKLGGNLTGKLNISGPFRSPEVTGNFIVRNGLLGRVDYDRAMIQFRGVPPYIPLQDSKIMRGRSTFLLAGAINFSLDNIFQEITVQTSDKLILWKGLELATSEEEKELSLGAFGGAALSLTSGPQSAPKEWEEKSRLDQDDEAYLGVGPKLRF